MTGSPESPGPATARISTGSGAALGAIRKLTVMLRAERSLPVAIAPRSTEKTSQCQRRRDFAGFSRRELAGFHHSIEADGPDA